MSENVREQLMTPYEITSTVLELDAAENPNVRPYDFSDEAEQRLKWETDFSPLLDRMSDFRRTLHRGKALWDETKSQPLYEKQLTNRDVLLVAFLGTSALSPDSTGPLQEPSVQEPTLGLLDKAALQRIGIPKEIANDSQLLVQVILHRLQDQPFHPTSHTSAPSLRQRIATANFNETRRIVAPLLQSKAGCALVSQCGHEIAAACTRDKHLLDQDGIMMAATFLKSVSSRLAHFDFKFISSI